MYEPMSSLETHTSTPFRERCQWWHNCHISILIDTTFLLTVSINITRTKFSINQNEVYGCKMFIILALSCPQVVDIYLMQITVQSQKCRVARVDNVARVAKKLNCMRTWSCWHAAEDGELRSQNFMNADYNHNLQLNILKTVVGDKTINQLTDIT